MDLSDKLVQLNSELEALDSNNLDFTEIKNLDTPDVVIEVLNDFAMKNTTKKIIQILDDMADTMYNADGVGLAAPQVGILKRVVVIDIGDGLLELINPEIIEVSGEQLDDEGCLSVAVRKIICYNVNNISCFLFNISCGGRWLCWIIP